ncbi:glycine-rich RNA-binding protein GRP2A-like [Solenopsis invicta]|uniref:glycine-rich RNA-binding protein GRP2A-like n=1 Tax=Solenopsis invicta TaxID=13686 RepID=UPI00193E6B62|nr:glycine-rich RNA-binding protein GRP2A-like [Solenopsis invicta]
MSCPYYQCYIPGFQVSLAADISLQTDAVLLNTVSYSRTRSSQWTTCKPRNSQQQEDRCSSGSKAVASAGGLQRAEISINFMEAAMGDSCVGGGIRVDGGGGDSGGGSGGGSGGSSGGSIRVQGWLEV